MTTTKDLESNAYILYVQDAQQRAVIRITSEGRLFWREREVETNDDFRAAMLELRDYFMGKDHEQITASEEKP